MDSKGGAGQSLEGPPNPAVGQSAPAGAKDTDWPLKVAKAKEARRAAHEARRGKPSVLSTSTGALTLRS